MPYTITLTNGTELTTIQDTTLDNTTSLTLLGKDYAGYGGIVAEDLVHMLENFSFSTPPPFPLTGQLWYNTGLTSLQIWNGTAWITVGYPANGLVNNPSLILTNPACPLNEKNWRITVSNTPPYVGMLLFQALNDDLSVKNTVMALDGVNNLILGAATYS